MNNYPEGKEKENLKQKQNKTCDTANQGLSLKK